MNFGRNRNNGNGMRALHNMVSVIAIAFVALSSASSFFSSVATSAVAAASDIDLDLVDTSELQWKSKASLPLVSTNDGGVHHPIVFANSTHGFVLSGSTRTQSYTTMFYMYEVSSDTWTDLSNTKYAFPGTPRSYGYGVYSPSDCGNSIAYVGFGSTYNYRALKDLWSFDMSTGIWKRLPDLPGKGRLHPAMNYVEETNEIQVGLGNGDGGNFNDWWSYNIQTSSWTQLPNFPSSKRHHPYYFVLGTDSYVGFGHSNGYNPWIERDWYKFDSIQRAWSSVGDFVSYEIGSAGTTTEARVAGTQFTVSNGSCDDNNPTTASYGFVLSGDGEDHSWMDTGEFHIFDPGSEKQWRELPPHPGSSRWAPNAFVLQGSTEVFMVGGQDRNTGILHGDVWSIDVQPIFDATVVVPTPPPTPPLTPPPTPVPPSCVNQSIDFQIQNQKGKVQPKVHRCDTLKISKRNNKKRKRVCNKRTTINNGDRVKKICAKRCGAC